MFLEAKTIILLFLSLHFYVFIKNTFAFRSGRIALIWKDREYSFRFQGFLSNLTKNVIPVSHVL